MNTSDVALPVHKRHIDFHGALHTGVNTRKTQTPFIAAGNITALGHDFGIKHDQGHLDIGIKPLSPLLFHIHSRRNIDDAN